MNLKKLLDGKFQSEEQITRSMQNLTSNLQQIRNNDRSL